MSLQLSAKAAPMPDSASPNAACLIPLNALAKHLEKQVRGRTDPAVVNRYRLAMKNGDVFPPLTVADVNGALVLVDGFHRRAASELLGEWQVPCTVIPCATLDEAEWWAFNANLRHGQPLKASSRRPAFQAFIRAGKNVGADGRLLSYRDIARAIPGVSHSAVYRYMRDDFPDIFSMMSGGMDDAEGGLRPSHLDRHDSHYELTMKALELLDSAEALMEGVDVPGLRGRVAERGKALAGWLEMTGAGITGADEHELF